jgi:exodeoxyribonuclease VII large subunit
LLDRFGLDALMGEAPRINIVECTVSELSAALRRTVEDAYGYVRVRGEVSGFRGPHSSGHAYFALKDEGARIEAVIWKSVFGRMRIKPEEGLEVIATGRLTTYPGRSTYQIVIESLEPSGIGALMALLEERKRKLSAEGLFDDARKQLLPFLPSLIGVITSPTGAVIRDILHRLTERFPRRVVVWPVRVQGDGSAEQVAAAIQGFNALPAAGPIPRPDLLIVARGGGSLEDLWSFNDEMVVRAAAASVIPLISAVGHETDVTLIDFAADRRAPTPTAAAEMAVPVRCELVADIEALGRRSRIGWSRSHEGRRTELRACIRAWPTPDALLGGPRQRVDAAAERLPRALKANAQIHLTHYSRTAVRLTPHMLRSRLVREADRVRELAQRQERATSALTLRRRERLSVLAARLQVGLRTNRDVHRQRIFRDRERLSMLLGRAGRATMAVIERRAAMVSRAGGVLGALSYHGVLARGFALVRDPDGQPVRTAAAVPSGMRLDIEFADGHLAAVAEPPECPESPVGDAASPTAEPGPAKPRAARPRGDPGQGNLFGG